MYQEFFTQFANSLISLSNQLDKAEAYAQARKFDIQNLLQSRLAPDQFPLGKQVQIACDNAKLAAARLSGQEAPKHDDSETTIDEFKARIQHTVDYLRSFKEEDFSDAANKKIILPFMPSFYFDGNDYLYHFVVPNFFFHVTTAYAILRHNGVELGKQDFMHGLPMKPVEA